MNVYDLLLLISSVLSLACMIYLARHYIRIRNTITLLLVVFFAMFSLTWIGYLLINTGFFEFDIITYILYVSLVDFGVILLIGLAMIRLKELYLLPASILIIAYFHEYALSASRDQLTSSIQVLLYTNYGQIIGNPWYIVISDMINGPSQILYSEILDLFFNPLSLIIPRIDITIIGIYLFIISAPTIVLFYYIAWKNRSGRSLGFAIGLTVLNLNLIFGINQDIIAVTILVATVFFALGIFGIFDRVAKTGSQETKE